MSVSGLVAGETGAVLSGALGYGGNSQGAVNAGRYAVLPQGVSSGNYDIRFVAGDLVVNPATLTLTAAAATRTAGAANPAYTGSVSGFVGGDTLGSATTGSLVFTADALPPPPKAAMPSTAAAWWPVPATTSSCRTPPMRAH